MRLIALLMFFACAAASAGDAPSMAHAPRLACPQCGNWDLVTASLGLAGEQIVITPEQVDIPVLGSFCAHVLTQTVENEGVSVRTYRMTLNLAVGDTCAYPDPDSLRMEVLVPGAWQTEGSVIKIAVYRASSRDAVFNATAWNAERKDPCDNGGGSPGTDCGIIAHARTFKRLAYLMYALQEGRRPREVAQLARHFDLPRFASSVRAFCLRREVESGAGATLYWSMECQNERLDAKLQEWQAWSTCNAVSNRPCAMPTERFDKSKRSFSRRCPLPSMPPLS